MQQNLAKNSIEQNMFEGRKLQPQQEVPATPSTIFPQRQLMAEDNV